MRAFAFVALIAALVAVAAAARPAGPPKLSDSFTANVNFHEQFGSYNFSVYGSWYVDFVGRQHAFHTNDQTFGAMQVFRYFNLSKQYEFYVNSGFCNEQMGLKMPFWGTFDFLARSANTGKCQDVHGNQGLLWTAYINDQPGMSFSLNLCASATANIPYFLQAMGQYNYINFERQIEFFGYYPGTPDPSLFALPNPCKQ